MTTEMQPRRIRSRAIAMISSAVILSVGIGYGLSLVGSGLAAEAGNAITVTGQARTSAVADNAVWILNVQESSQQVANSVTKVEKSVAALSAYLTDGGIPTSGIQAGGVNTNAINEYVNGNPTGRILSYQANQNVTVRSKDVKLLSLIHI